MLPLTVELNHNYTVIEVEGDRQGIETAIQFCFKTFGPAGNRWFFKPYKFYFKSPRDAMMFDIRF